MEVNDYNRLFTTQGPFEQTGEVCSGSASAANEMNKLSPNLRGHLQLIDRPFTFFKFTIYLEVRRDIDVNTYTPTLLLFFSIYPYIDQAYYFSLTTFH